MKIKLSGIFYYYFIFSLISLTCITGYGGYFFWKKGMGNFDLINKVFEASYKFDEIKERKDITRLKNLIENDRLRESIKVLNKFETDLKTLSFLEGQQEYSVNIKNSIRKTKNSMTELLSFPELSSIIFVLGKKVNKFGDFVTQKQWRTLSRMTKIMKAKMAPGKIKRPGFFSYQKLERFSYKIKFDLRRMKNITNSSLLNRNDKNIILENLKTLNTEVFMLERYLGFLKKLMSEIKSLEKNYKVWNEGVGPLISLQKLNFYKNAKNSLTFIVGLFFGTLIFLFLGILLKKAKNKKDVTNIENIILKCIGEGIIPLKNRLKYNFSNQFKEHFKKYKMYLHKRMEFGAIFQEGVPFSGILIDSNLNVIWGNKLFYENWGLLDYKERNEILTWDFLKKYTNLGESTPIISALKENIAGIYQIQVKINSDTMPYEMYVSPINYAEKIKIMILFYPLRSLEETLANQTKAIIGPVSRSLEALMSNHFNPVFKENIKNDFNAAGINQLFDKFCKYNEFVCQQRMGLLKEIERLENNLYDQYKLVDDLTHVFNEKRSLQGSVLKKFDDTKNSIIELIQSKNEIERSSENIIHVFKEFFNIQSGLLKKSKDIKVLFEENEKTFSRVFRLKDNVKELRVTIFEFRNKILRSIDQSLAFQKSENDSSKLGQSLSKIKLEINGFDKVLHNFSQIMTNLDVALSKIQLLLENKDLPKFDEVKAEFNLAKKNIDAESYNLKRSKNESEAKSSEMVDHLKVLYDKFLLTSEKQKQSEELIVLSRNNPEFGSLSVNQIDYETRKRYGEEINI